MEKEIISYSDDYCYECEKGFRRGLDHEHDRHNTIGKKLAMDKALELWKRLFERIPSPYEENIYEGIMSCFFCGRSDSHPHRKDCIWIEAKKLVEENK